MRSGFKSLSLRALPLLSFHSLLYPNSCYWRWKSLSRVWLFTPPWTPWDSPGQNTGEGSLHLLQDLSNPGIKPRSPALQVDSLPAEPPGKPKNTGMGSLFLLFPGRPSLPRNQTQVSCIAGRFFTSWATRETLSMLGYMVNPGKPMQINSLYHKYVSHEYWLPE